ncbi:hypothetical protein [Candidatus Methanocrinis natronophilus]|uniref:Uncharacterized protein n=1 Tax=Candidatus Methanocrinis natronophilus TaxID=3033396 RepID=A0ABT5XAS2_9EURY|nr:hypothetical protein [Candidatus Methanocrinis natronophilus]MDF0591672.1 hypothetical protein [Candidatus Methanocrinis natronophilus]
MRSKRGDEGEDPPSQNKLLARIGTRARRYTFELKEKIEELLDSSEKKS